MSTPWKSYYEKTQAQKPSPLLLEFFPFLDAFDQKGKVLDVGAGALRDTKFFLEQGYEVVAVDQAEAFLDYVQALHHPHLFPLQMRIQDYDFPALQFQLVNAQYSLPFLPKKDLERVLGQIQASLVAQGLFVGQFFGVRDTWNDGRPTMSFMTEGEVRDILSSFEVIHFQEEERDGQTALGDTKHWHVFHCVGRRG